MKRKRLKWRKRSRLSPHLSLDALLFFFSPHCHQAVIWLLYVYACIFPFLTWVIWNLYDKFHWKYTTWPSVSLFFIANMENKFWVIEHVMWLALCRLMIFVLCTTNIVSYHSRIYSMCVHVFVEFVEVYMLFFLQHFWICVLSLCLNITKLFVSVSVSLLRDLDSSIRAHLFL